MSQQEQQPIRFDKIFKKDFLDKVHDRFREHIKLAPSNVYFIDLLKNEIITANDLLTIQGDFIENDIHMNETEIAQFLNGNCFNYEIPRMVKEGHDFTNFEKAHVAGFLGFVDMMTDEGYPHEYPEQQAKEHHEQTSESFVNTCFQWGTESLVKMYDEMYPEQVIKQ